MSISSNISIADGATVINNSVVNHFSNIIGLGSNSTWRNNSGSQLRITGALLSMGILDVATAPNEVHYNGSGNQTIKVPLASYSQLICSNSGTKSMNGNVTVEEMIIIRNTAVLDQSTFSLSGNADLQMLNESELRITRSSNALIPELLGNFDLQSGTVTLEQTGGTATIAEATYYNLNLIGSAPYNLVNVSEIANNFTIQNGSTIQSNADLMIQNNFTYSSSNSSTLANNLTVGNFILNSGTINDGGRRITILGSGWTRDGGTFTTTGRVAFEGEVEQTIGGSNSTVFSGLEINNSSPTGVRLNRTTEVSRILTLINGYLYTSNSNILIFRDNATSSQGSSFSFVAGPARKDGNDDFVFPLGADKQPVGFGPEDRWARAGISAPASVGNSFTAEYIYEDPHSQYNTSSKQAVLQTVSRMEYWMINRVSGSDPVNVSLYFENAMQQGIRDCDMLRVARWNGSEWEEKASTSSGTCYGNVSGSVTTTAAFVSFSPFTFASTGTVNSLPIQLLSFEAKYAKNNIVKVDWTTATETDNEYFLVERSKNGIDFETVTKMNGAGNSLQKINYTANDFNPYSGHSYYRLKQVDYNGEFSFSPIKTVISNAHEAVEVKIYPNPVSAGQKLSVVFNSGNVGEGILTVQMIDIQGRVYLTKALQSSHIGRELNIEIPENLTGGIYFIKGTNSVELFKQKILVK